MKIVFDAYAAEPLISPSVCVRQTTFLVRVSSA